jgi:hypothetical protein
MFQIIQIIGILTINNAGSSGAGTTRSAAGDPVPGAYTATGN